MARHRLFYIASLAAILLYNNWVLAIFLNPKASFSGASTSELGVYGQPHAALFRVLDITAGLLFLLGLPALADLAEKQRRYRVLLIVGVAVLGLSTIIESIMPLDCSSALNQTCAIHESMGITSWRDSFHTVESVISYALIASIPLGAYLLLRRQASKAKLRLFSLLLVLFMAAWGVETAIRYLGHAQRYGYEQRLFIMLFTFWYYHALRAGRQA